MLRKDEAGAPHARLRCDTKAATARHLRDQAARHAHQSFHRRQDGFKAHVAVEPNTGLVVASALTEAAGPGSTDPVA